MLHGLVDGIDTDAVTDKVRESVARNAVFNQVFGTMVSEGRMSKEDAIDNFIINLLIWKQ